MTYRDQYGFNERFERSSIDELVQAFNREVGSRAWVGVRAVYLDALMRALLARGVDCSDVIQGGSIHLSQRVRLDGRRLVIDPALSVIADATASHVAAGALVPARQLFYRVVRSGVVFARPDDAKRVAAVHAALAAARNWGEFRAMMPPDEYERVIDLMDDVLPDDGDAHSSAESRRRTGTV